MNDPFWNTVFAVWFALIVVVVAVRLYGMAVDYAHVLEYKRQHPEGMIGEEGEESAFLPQEPPGGYRTALLPSHPDIANSAEPGTCPFCGQPWPLPGPLPNKMAAPSPEHMPGNPCTLCGRNLPQTAPAEQAPSSN